MAVFRIEKTNDFTIMSNHHLRNESLSLKAKGLLSLMLSLPENWDYTTKGLAAICKDGVDSICAGVQELERHGYVVRERVRNAHGQLGAIEYTILERPREPEPEAPEQEEPKQENPVQAEPKRENPEQVFPKQEKPEQGNPAQLSTKESRKELSSTQESNPILSSFPGQMDAIGAYRSVVLENIGYEILRRDKSIDRNKLTEIVSLIVDTVCSTKKTFRIGGTTVPAEKVKLQMMKLDSTHVQYVMDCMQETTTKIRNIQNYLLTALYNAPMTMGSYYDAKVQHDLYGAR